MLHCSSLQACTFVYMVTDDRGWVVHVGLVALDVLAFDIQVAICCSLACIWLVFERRGHFYFSLTFTSGIDVFADICYSTVVKIDSPDVVMYLCALWTTIGTLYLSVCSTLLGVLFWLEMHLWCWFGQWR